ncbi:MAG: ABC transporter ATP-binding protein, partial [Chloroflexi bacterium]|nr:ABC transporter ATP-binding protein [Chloroflexota bacterium]
MTTPAAELEGVVIGYGGEPVVSGLALTVEADEMVVLLGPSGSGKSTILGAIAGFVPIRSGVIRIGGRVVAGDGRHEPPERRDVGVVFQGSALWPHLSALDTVAYPLRRRGVAAETARREAGAILARLGIERLADRRPAEMSGGEQQRVGLGRALARAARLHLFDEPTAHLDGPLRDRLLGEIAVTRRESGAAGMYATHDTAEALAIADRVLLLRDGAVVQAGTPTDVYEAPVDAWAARLTGPASEIEARIVSAAGDLVELEVAGVRIRARVDGCGSPGEAADDPVRLLVRPDWAAIGGPLPGRVTASRFRGSHTDVDLGTPAGLITIRQPGPPSVAVGDLTGWSLRRGRSI